MLLRLTGGVDPRMAWAVWRRNLCEYSHTWLMNLLPNFFEPFLYLVGMGIGLGFYLGREMDGQSYVAFIAPGLLAASAMNGATFETTYNMLVKMTYAKLYDAYMTTPAQIEDIVVGEILWATTRATLYGGGFLVVLLILCALGYPLVSSAAAFLLPFAIVLIGAMFALIGAVFTAYVKVIDLYSYFWTLFMTPLFLFSGIFFPVERFPGGEAIAWFSPLWHGVRLTRALAQGPLEGAVLADIVWMLVLTLVLLWWVPRKMRARFFR